MQSNQEKNEFNLKRTIRFCVKYWKVLLIVFFASAIITAGLSLLFKNYYKAQVTLLAADTNSISKGVLSQMDVADPLEFGKEKETEHLLELLSSGKIMSDVIAKFNLKEHYGIKAEGKELDEKLGRKLYNNIKVKRTENLAVKLSVWDTDPVYAANIANYIVERLTALHSTMKKEKMDSICMAMKRSQERIIKSIDLLSDSLSALCMQHKIYFPDVEAERLTQEIAKQVAAGNNAAVARLDKRFETLQQYGPKIENIKEQLTHKRITLRSWSEQLEKAIIDADANAPVEFIIESAYPTYYKDKPKRSIIVLFSALCCTLLAVAVLVVKDRAKAVENE